MLRSRALNAGRIRSCSNSMRTSFRPKSRDARPTRFRLTDSFGEIRSTDGKTQKTRSSHGGKPASTGLSVCSTKSGSTISAASNRTSPYRPRPESRSTATGTKAPASNSLTLLHPDTRANSLLKTSATSPTTYTRSLPRRDSRA